MKKCLKITLLLVLLLAMLLPSFSYGASWQTVPFGQSNVTNLVLNEFYDIGSGPQINAWFDNKASLSRSYTIELQRQNLDGTWSVYDSRSGTLVRGWNNVGFSTNTGSLRATFRYVIKVNGSSVDVDGTYRFYN